ncbi:MAG: hypothetical protein QOJ99_1419 [Bryobacterales bacterium]|jgi:hypothetical protein|nr:hypothetical protein [Bryobacterales bacterium]
MVIAFDGSRDIFHPLMYICPMFLFIYTYMPMRLHSAGQLAIYFDDSQLVFIQMLNLLGVIAFIGGCLAAGFRTASPGEYFAAQVFDGRRLLIGGAVAGTIGLVAWIISIVNVGGFVNAFDHSYGGGWDSSGYVRDAAILLLIGVLLIQGSMAVSGPGSGPSFTSITLAIVFATPWLVQALLTSRRGPTFAFAVMAGASWYLYRNRRPPLILGTVMGLALGYFIIFLVVNRNNIHLGTDLELSTDVTSVTEGANTGNEYIYGGGAVLSSRKAGHYYWGKRYLAQVTVRPIPSAIWPTKYADFGLPELLTNAGTGEGFGEALGWKGAPGSAPGVIADLWLEFWWFSVPVLALMGWGYGRVWLKAVTMGGPWLSQYCVFFAISIYFVMQTMEAVIFRTIQMSIPIWITWTWAARRYENVGWVPRTRWARPA